MEKALENIIDKELDPAFRRRAKFILKRSTGFENHNILDLGCGRGYYLKLLDKYNSNCKLYGIDNNDKYLSNLKNYKFNNKTKVVKGDIYNLDFENNFFDIIILSEVLEHLKDESKALNEIKRVLKPKGILLLSVPSENYPPTWDPINFLLEKIFNKHINKNIWWLAGIWADHERLYSPANIRSTLEKEGFEINELVKSTSASLPFLHFLLYGIGKNLVEEGFISNDFNRFKINSIESKPKKLIRKVINFFDRNKVNKSKFHQNILIQAKIN